MPKIKMFVALVIGCAAFGIGVTKLCPPEFVFPVNIVIGGSWGFLCYVAEGADRRRKSARGLGLSDLIPTENAVVPAEAIELSGQVREAMTEIERQYSVPPALLKGLAITAYGDGWMQACHKIRPLFDKLCSLLKS